MHEFEGGCHCGNVAVHYRTEVAPEDAKPRACQCGFCRRHQTSAISDPNGELQITIKDAADVNRYTFEHASAQFLICRICGVYVSAYMPSPDDNRGFATLMSFALDVRERYPAATAVHYDGQDGEDKRTRRERMWTPAVVRTLGGD